MNNFTSTVLTALAVSIMFLTLSCTKEQDKTEHVILIGLDGMGGEYFSREDMPVVASLMDSGCWTLKKRSAFKTSSAINWASMFMGAGPELHGYTHWYSEVPDLEPRAVNGHGIFPTVFSILREQRPESEIGCLFEWKTIGCLVDSLSLDFCEQSVDAVEHPESTADIAIRYITEKKPTLFAIAYNEPDHVGHSEGWDTEAYHKTVQYYDGEIARILQGIKDAGIWENTTVIITADHGGIDHGHGEITPQEYNTPFIISGKGIKQGGEFSESMMQYDVASTIAAMFNLEQPQVWIGRPMNQCFED